MGIKAIAVLLCTTALLLSLPACSTSPVPTGIALLSPQPGANNVFLRSPFQVTFDKPIDAGEHDSLDLSVTDSGGTSYSTDATLSVDGTVLSILLIEIPPVPNTLTVRWSGEINGHNVGPTDWMFDVPAWVPVAPTLLTHHLR